jgi:hypothetical protein
MRRISPRLAALSLAILLHPSWLVAASPPPGLPPGVHPLAPELAKHMDELVHAAEKYRGLRLKRPVPYGALDEQALKARAGETGEEDRPADEMRSLEVSLQAFGLLPEGANVKKIYRDLLVQQVAAFYDPERNYLAMVDHPRENGAEALVKAFGAERARRVQEGILVHELTHAIDDQHFDIGKGPKDALLADGSSAYLGLVEGDATLIMFDYILGERLEAIPGASRTMGVMLKDPHELAALAPELPGSAGLASAPAWFRDKLLFTYFQGFSFCLDVERRGGQKLLDYAFAKDPPRSTEQILHPEKWHGHRNDPIGLAWPDLAAALPGWKKAAEGQLGEEGIGILLRTAQQDSNLAAAAAAGWGGDRFAIYEKDGKRLLLWLTEWDTEADATEFQTAAAKLPPGGASWTVTRPALSRVVLIRGIGDRTPEQQSRVEAALAAVRAERPANRDIDFAALGITAKPDEKLAKELYPDGRTFTDRAAGFSIRLPAVHEGWEIVPDPDPKSRVQLVGKGVIVAVLVDDLGVPAELDDLLPTFKSQTLDAGVRLLSGSVVERAGTRAYERLLEEKDGSRTFDRKYVHGTKLIVVAAFVPGEAWKKMEGTIREIFDSVTLFSPELSPAPPPAKKRNRPGP